MWLAHDGLGVNWKGGHIQRQRLLRPYAPASHEDRVSIWICRVLEWRRSHPRARSVTVGGGEYLWNVRQVVLLCEAGDTLGDIDFLLILVGLAG